MRRNLVSFYAAMSIGSVALAGCASGGSVERADISVPTSAATATTQPAATAPASSASEATLAPRLKATTRLAVTDCLDKAQTFGMTSKLFPTNFDDLVEYCREALTAVESDGPWEKGTAGDQLLETLLTRISTAELVYDAVLTGNSSKLTPDLVFPDGRPNYLEFDSQHEDWAADVAALVAQIS